jgi:hypothetical protein
VPIDTVGAMQPMEQVRLWLSRPTRRRKPRLSFGRCQQGKWVEPDSVVGRYRADAPVRVVVAQTGCRPTLGQLGKPANRVLEKCHGIQPLNFAARFTASIS